MKQMILTTTVASCLALPLLSFDVQQGTTLREKAEIFVRQTPKRDQLYLGPDIFWTNESLNLKGTHIKDKNVYYGLRAAYDLLRPSSLYAGVEGMYALGRMHIQARTHKGEAKVFAHREKVGGIFANGEVRLGYNFRTEAPFYLTPFVGLGFYHTRPMRAIHYTQNWSYAAVGIKADYDIGSRVNIGLNVKGTRALYLEQRFKKHAHAVSHHKTSDVLGYSVAVPVTVHLGSAKGWDMRAEPYYLKLNSHSNANVIGGQLAISAKY